MKYHNRTECCRTDVRLPVLLMLLSTLAAPARLAGQTVPADLAGHSETSLPDGRILLIGGDAGQGPVSSAHILDPRTGSTVAVGTRLVSARAWHTATMLPDGTVLILGGVGKDGAIGQAPEVFDPESLTFHSLPEGLPTPRAFHTATLLVDGRVIIAGGVGRDGSTLAEVEMWDSRSRSFQRSALLLPAPRSRHTAALLGDGGMLIGGGVAANGEPVAAIDVYDPRRDAFRSRPDAVQAEQPGLAESIPGDGATNVPLSTIIGLRFAVPVRVETANTTTVSIRDGQGSPVAAKIVPAEGGMLLFLVPSEPLRPGVNYAVMLDGLSGIDGAPLRFAQLAFTTATAEPLVSPAVPVSSIPNAVSSRTVAGAPSLAAVSGAGRRYSPTYPTWSPPTTPGPKCGNDSNYEGDPVDCATGIFVHTRTDLYLPDVMPISLTRTYRSGDSAPRPFGLGTSHPYEIFIWLPDYPDTYLSADLYLADGAKFHYTRITPGTEAANTAMEHTSTPGAFYKSRIETNNGASWFLTLRDGTQYTFIMSTTYPPVPTSIRDRNGNQITITRVVTDPARQGDIKRITSPSGRYIEFSYDSQHRIVEARDNIGRIVKYEYGGFYGNVLTKVTDPDGGVTEYTYTTDGNARMLTVRDARGIVHVTNEYDANGRVSRQMLVDGAVWTYAYTLNHQGNVKSSDATNPRGTVIKKTFNSDGYTLTDTLVSGRDQIKTTFDRQAVTNLVTRVTDPLGRKTDYTYDTCGNVASITRAAGTQQAVTTTFAYQVGSTCVAAPSLLASVTDPLSHATTFGYDAKGNVTSITNPLTNQTTLTYNGAGQPLTVRNALQKTWQFTYTSGDLTTVTDPLQRTTNQVIDFAGRVASVTNPFGQASFHEYDPLNRLRKLTDPLIGATEFSYDANGNLLSLKDARNGSTGYAYDNMDRPASRTDPLLRVESYLYDLNGNVTRFTDRKSQITNYSYDAFDRLTQVAYQDGSTTSYTYDLAGRITQVTDSVSGTITFTYDSLNRLTQDVTPQGTVSYTYDAAGRRTSMTAAGQAAVNYSYDNADRLTQITQGTNTVAFTYDVGDQRTSTTLPNGIVMAYRYDDAGQLIGIDYKQGSTLLGDLSYQYDAAGRRSAMGGSFARTGLPAALASAVYDAANRLTQWGGTALAYDLNGNLTSDGVNTYTWNARDQLSSMTRASFQYDAIGRRSGRTVGGATTDYLHDGLNVVKQTGASAGDLLTGLGIDEMFTRTDAAGSRHFLTDALGSTLGLADAAGQVQTQYTFQPFGSVTASGQTNGNAFQYTGRENDGTGLYYYRARYYHPGLQRFMSEDSLGFGGGDVNLYAYVANTPILYTDPTGSCPWCLAAAAGLGTGALTDLVLQLLQNGGRLECIDRASIASAAATGALTSSLGPTGFLLGRGGARAIQYGYNKAPGLLNRWSIRFGWSGPKGGHDVLSFRLGKRHFDIPGIKVPSGANPWRDGAVAGTLGGAGNRGRQTCSPCEQEVR